MPRIRNQSPGPAPVLSALTSRIQADLPGWFGPQAGLAGAPTFHARRWSFFFRYPIQAADAHKTAILVKMRHLENMGVAEAAADEKMGREIKDEYESLRLIETIFSRHAEARLFYAIHALAWYEDLNAIVMEEADIRPLKSFFHAPAMWVEGKARRRLETFLERAGRWLRIYHDHSGHAREGPLFHQSLYKESREKLRIIEASPEKPDLSFARELLKNLYRTYGEKNLPYNVLHHNFSVNNVFVTGDGKICSFDPHHEPGPLYYDLAKLIVDLQTSSLQVVSRGRLAPDARLKTFNEAFLDGYFQGSPVDRRALDLFRFLILIEKWERSESKRSQAAGGSRYAYRFGARYLQTYYLRLLRRQALEQEYGI